MIPDIDPKSRLSCGVDLVDVASFGRAIEITGGRLLDACFTPREQREAAGSYERLATRWGIKEAVGKALGVGLLQGVGFHDIEVTVSEGGRLELRLSGGARLLATSQHLEHWAISVSHEQGLSIGFVIATGAPAAGYVESIEEDGDG
jgi:holo-[acyl-carrier protein] synthase